MVTEKNNTAIGKPHVKAVNYISMLDEPMMHLMTKIHCRSYHAAAAVKITSDEISTNDCFLK